MARTRPRRAIRLRLSRLLQQALAPVPGERPPRMRERELLLWNLLPLVLGVFAVGVTAPNGFASGARAAALTLLPLYAGCLALHALLCVLRFEGDALFLPILSLLFGIAGIYHLGIQRPGAAPGADAYVKAALVGLAVIAVLVSGSRWLRRLGLWFEEKVWWRLAGDLPYYSSAPFHVALLGGMVVLVLWLKVFGRTAGSEAIVLAPLPGGWSFTPSEFVRLAVAFFLAEYLAANSKILRNLRQPLGERFPFNRIMVEHKPELLVVLTMLVLYGLFFYVFRDFGPAVVIFALTLLCLLAATRRAPTPLALLAIALLVVALPAYYGWGFRTLNHRVAMWLHPWSTEFPNGDHLARALWGVASGGWLGIGVGTVNLYGLLPEAARDTVFAGLATTMGFWVVGGVLVLFAALAWRGYTIARAAPTDHARMLAFSLTTLLALQVIWICAASVGVLPLSGINLPFMSTGISNMVVSCVAVAVLLQISRTTNDQRPTTNDGGTGAVLDGVTRIGRGVVIAFAAPLLGLVAYGVPWFLGDRTLVRTASAVGRVGEKTQFANPYLDQFRAQFPRGRILTADAKVLADDVGRGDGATRRRSETSNPADSPRRPVAGSPRRNYPMGAATAQLVGWTSQGRFASAPGSVEALYDSELRGYAERDLVRLFRGRHRPLANRPKPRDVILTIRSDLQRFATQRLSRAVRRAGGTGGAAVLFDAGTGKVLAAATAPAFDPNRMTLARMKALQEQHAATQILAHKGVSRDTLFFPGSTLKLVTAAAALQQPPTGRALCRSANGNELRWEHNGTRYRRRVGKIHDYGASYHGEMGLESGIGWGLTVSCNVFFATLATQVGAERLSQTMRDAGLRVAPDAKTLAPYLAEAGFGQVVVKVAPVEMARLAGAIGRANEEEPGCAEPYWVDRTRAERGETAAIPPGRMGSASPARYQPFSPDVARALREMMLGVVSNPSGTAYRAFHDAAGAPVLGHLEVGGKTGTAEFDKLVKRKDGTRVAVKRKHAWFVGFAQDPRRFPRQTLAVAVLIEDVRGRGTGGTVAAPVARDLFAAALPPDGSESGPTPSGNQDWLGNLLDRIDSGVGAVRRLRRMFGRESDDDD